MGRITRNRKERKPTTFIYVLCDPNTAVVHYVGQSVDPRHRLFSHLAHAMKHKSSPKDLWICDVLAGGEKPTLKIICEVATERALAEEIHWIQEYKKLNPMLTNVANAREKLVREPKQPQKQVRIRMFEPSTRYPGKVKYTDEYKEFLREEAKSQREQMRRRKQLRIQRQANRPALARHPGPSRPAR